MRHPGVKPSIKRPHAGDPLLHQHQRHTGASSFVRSSTVQDHIAIPRNLQMALLYFGGPHGYRPREPAVRGQGVPQIEGAIRASRMCRRNFRRCTYFHEMKHVNPAAANAITHEPSVSAASAATCN